MTYIKNADLTRKNLYRLIQRANCKDITDSCVGYAIVVETEDIDIIGFKSLVDARRWLSREEKRVKQERKKARDTLIRPGLACEISQDEVSQLPGFYSGVDL